MSSSTPRALLHKMASQQRGVCVKHLNGCKLLLSCFRFWVLHTLLHVISNKGTSRLEHTLLVFVSIISRYFKQAVCPGQRRPDIMATYLAVSFYVSFLCCGPLPFSLWESCRFWLLSPPCPCFVSFFAVFCGPEQWFSGLTPAVVSPRVSGCTLRRPLCLTCVDWSLSAP